jgi:glycosyltransferase involved in cell wall biosynthesis
MRITIVFGPFLPVPPVLGGAVEKVHLGLAEAYRHAGHEVTLISRKYKDFADNEAVDGIRHIRVPAFDRAGSLAANLALDFRYAWRVSRMLPASDVTVTNSFFLPVLLRHRTAGKIYVHVARMPKHQMWLYSRADRLQAISRSVADEIIRQAPALAPKVRTIGYPVSDAYFPAGAAQPRRKVILFVGRIAREKGVHLLLRAFASMRAREQPADITGWTLRIVGPHDVTQGGDGPGYFNELAQLAAPLGTACEFIGPVFDERALIKEYQSASIFVYPSVAESGEAFGLAPLEAMAAGCAVVVSDLRCFDDFVEEGANALRFNHRAAHPTDELAAKLTQLVSQPTLAGTIATKGMASAQEFRTSAIAAKMLDDFAQLAGTGTATPATQA